MRVTLRASQSNLLTNYDEVENSTCVLSGLMSKDSYQLRPKYEHNYEKISQYCMT